MQMANSTVGFILGLIGGILGIIGGIVVLTIGGAATFLAMLPIGKLFGALYTVLGIWYTISGALVIWFSTWMRDPKRCRNGGIWTLILSVIGSGGILGIIGGIFGIVQGGK